MFICAWIVYHLCIICFHLWVIHFLVLVIHTRIHTDIHIYIHWHIHSYIHASTRPSIHTNIILQMHNILCFRTWRWKALETYPYIIRVRKMCIYIYTHMSYIRWKVKLSVLLSDSHTWWVPKCFFCKWPCRNYYDIFFFDLQGNCIYSVFKESLPWELWKVRALFLMDSEVNWRNALVFTNLSCM